MTDQIVQLTGIDETGEQETDLGAFILADGELTAVVGPDGSDELLDSILSDPVFVLEDDSLVDVSSEEDPEQWFDNLVNHYKSVGLRASAPRPLAESDLVDYEFKD